MHVCVHIHNILVCFCVWAIMNNTAENISAQIFTQDSALVYLESYPEVE